MENAVPTTKSVPNEKTQQHIWGNTIDNPRYFLQHTDTPDMAKSNHQAMDYPYPTTTLTTHHTPHTTHHTPHTTHHALIACEAVRHVCPCDGDRDVKEDDCNSDGSTSDQFSRKQL